MHASRRLCREADRIGRTTISSHGYVRVFVGKDHHLADVAGYAYQHRLVMETKLRRCLAPGEIVHHDDRNKGNNEPGNLVLEPSRWHHNAKHRRLLTPRQTPGQPNERVACACGCGERIWRFNKHHVEMRFISGHNARLKKKKVCFPKRPAGWHNRIKTACPAGHGYTPGNTRVDRGRRICKTCHRLQEAARRKGWKNGEQIKSREV